MTEHGRQRRTNMTLGAIDLVVGTLIHFEETVAKGADMTKVIENIRYCGPA